MPDPVSMAPDPATSATAAVTTPEPAQTPASAPASTPTPEPSPAAASDSASSAAAAATGTPSTTGAPGAAPAPTPQPTWLTNLRTQGVDFGEDEAVALQRIREQAAIAQQHQQMQPWVQSYQQHAAQFNQWLTQQQAQGQQPQPGQPSQQQAWHKQFWNPPEYNPQWRQLVKQDEHGNLVPIPGAPPDVVPKLLAYQNFRQEQAEKLMQNPFEFFEPAIRHVAQQVAQEIAGKELGGYRANQEAQQFVQQNSSWLYELDNGQPKMQPVFDPASGRMVQQPQLSQWGQLFTQHVQAEHQKQQARGYIDLEEQKANALARVQAHYYSQQMSARTQAPAAPGSAAIAAPQQTARQQANANFLANNGQANLGGSPSTMPNVNPTETPVDGRNLAAMMKEAFAQAGINNDNFSVNGAR